VHAGSNDPTVCRVRGWCGIGALQSNELPRFISCLVRVLFPGKMPHAPASRCSSLHARQLGDSQVCLGAWVLGVGLYSLSILLGCVRHGGRYCMCRDLKMSNLLYKSGELKVADFGLARTFGYPNPKFTPKVCSRTQLGCCPRAVRHRYVWL
jgi:serine/threonine protein kinase